MTVTMTTMVHLSVYIKLTLLLLSKVTIFLLKIMLPYLQIPLSLF